MSTSLSAKKIYVLAGEASGDEHLSSVLTSLIAEHPDTTWEIRGFGGPKSTVVAKESGQPNSHIEDWIEDAAVVGITEVLKHYSWFKAKLNQAVHEIRNFQPDVVLLIDYPGFNLRLAKAIRHESVPTKILYYISPQVWAWNRRRIPAMARILDKMLCIFPFEETLYEESGLSTTFVGHPLIDELSPYQQDKEERDPNLVALLPGSRKREVERIFPLLLQSAAELEKNQASTQASKLKFVAAAQSEKTAAIMREQAAKHPELNLKIQIGESRKLMQKACCGAVASGTATLEAACLGLPYCLVYKVAWPTYLIAKILIKVDHLGMVNVLAGREIVQEFVQADATPEAVANKLQQFLQDPQLCLELQNKLQKVISSLGSGGAATRVAKEILRSTS